MSTISLAINSDTVVKKSGLAIGDAAFGGIVAYIYKPGDPGFISGQTKGIILGPGGNEGIGGTWQNAFDFADSYVNQGYTDWRLPIILEMETYFLPNRALIGLKADGQRYWTGTTDIYLGFAAYTFGPNVWGYYSGALSFYYRPVREF